jgi:hypothetical protein
MEMVSGNCWCKSVGSKCLGWDEMKREDNVVDTLDLIPGSCVMYLFMATHMLESRLLQQTLMIGT